MANLLIEKWYQAINQIAISTHLCSRLPLEYLSVWMKQDIFQANVFHNTLSILAYLFSDSKIIDAKDTITGFINRFIPIEDLLLFLNKEFSFETRSLLSNKDIERILEYGQQKNRITENNANPEKVLTKDSASYRNFISSGLFIERKHVFFQFSSPILTAFIISQQNQKDKTILWKNILFSCVDNQALQFSDAEVLLAKWIEEDDSPLFRNILLATNYFEFHKYSDSIQKKYINSVTKIIQDDSYPVNLRLRLLPLLYRIDKKLFLQLLTYFSQSSNSAYKQIACFGFCLYSTDREVEILNTLIDDKSEEVHFAALLALSQIWNTQTKKILIDVLLSGNEKSKQFICELLSTHPGEGWEILREITSIDNVLVRKSSIYGLKLINESWIKELLLKMSTEDSQWLIRDLAVSAINDLEKIKNIHEIKPNHPCDSQWLIQFASTHGIGIPSDKYPYELLFNVIEIGTAIERKAAISFLVERPNHQSIELLKSLTFGKSEISEFAINALYRIARTFDKL